MVTKKEVHRLLKNAGIRPDDTVLIHTSMKAIGEVDGGCDGLIDAFCSYLTDGLFLVPTHTWANVDESSPVYDVRATVPCIGALPRVAARREDGVRSLHPTHSIVAFGKKAAEFVAGEERATSPCPQGFAWSRLYDKKAKILLLGVGLNRNTYIHAIDEMLELPNRLTPPIPLSIIDYEGKRLEISFRKHGFTGSENFDNFAKPLEKCGALTYSTLGDARVGIFDTVKGTAMIKHLWQVASYHLCQEQMDIPENYYKDTEI